MGPGQKRGSLYYLTLMSDRAASGNNSYELHEEEIRNIFIQDEISNFFFEEEH
jgi:hypothetical protein